MTATIGAIDQVDLVIKRGSSIVFAVTYRADGVVVPIAEARSMIRTAGWEGDVYLDFADHIEIEDGKALVNVPGSVTTGLGALKQGRWDFEVTLDNGDDHTLWEGRVTVRPEATK